MAGMSKFIILLGGNLTPTKRLRQQIKGARVIAADSGIAHAATLGLLPELWVGDFDSSNSALDAAYAHVPRQVFPAAKDATDGELALRHALSIGASDIILVGGFGGQFDHALAHVTQLLQMASGGISCFASSGTEEAYPLLRNLDLSGLAAATRISIIAFDDLSALSISGVRWPLKNRTVAFGSTLTLSNETAGDVKIENQSGRALVLVYPPAEDEA